MIRLFVEIYNSTENRTLKSIKDKLFCKGSGRIAQDTTFIGFTLKHDKYQNKFFLITDNNEIEIRDSIK